MASFTESGIISVAQTLTLSEVGIITQTGGIFTPGFISVTMGDAFLANWGTMYSTVEAVRLTQIEAEIENHGSITGGNQAVIEGYFFVSGPTRLMITNYGDILANATSDTSGILTSGGGNRIINFGTITTYVDSPIEIYDANSGVNLDGNFIDNKGRITSQMANAIDLFNDDNDIVLNSGEITGSIGTGYGTDTFRNTGTIYGNVSMYSAANVFFNTGLITGFVVASGNITSTGTIGSTLYLGGLEDVVDLRGGRVLGGVTDNGGADTYLIDEPGLTITDTAGTGIDTVRAWCDFDLSDGLEVLALKGAAQRGFGSVNANLITGNAQNNVLSGVAGNDTLLGGFGDDRMSGGTENDSLQGGEDDDTLDGGSGVDLLFGNNGDDILRGGSGSDRIDGNNDDDRLLGGQDNDTIYGGAGNDVIQGGHGTDVMYGGTEADVFVFAHVSDSRNGVLRDIIASDFVLGTDMIDLSGVDARLATAGNDAFTYIGTAAFTVGTAGQLRYAVSGANVLVQGNVTGSGAVEFEIQVNGQGSIAANAFVL